ncbi:Leucine-, glutamate- and lysine-rich protein 1 [Heterocephalus glaber]|uniref:Leucine-, glutamate-and lysine-rich protein 1 n=1 Tax=Heterocephalus glaber TaxID=10181 RepID=G5B256_HETGA|nr:Leucine-, glutamate- and lysine-rich protein 1 [Heterocephalus glaber]
MTCQQIYKTLQEELFMKERQEEDTKRIHLAENELQISKTLLNQTKEEVVTLKNERELMLISHQKSTEKLQESLRQKLLSDANWREEISDLITGATRDLRLEVTALEEKLHEPHIRYTEESASKKTEIENLKNLVVEFESRLKKEFNNNDSVSQDNTVLQETVRRECEERFELTEALIQAREQLLELRKLHGSLPLSSCPHSKGSLTSSVAAVGNHRE